MIIPHTLAIAFLVACFQTAGKNAPRCSVAAAFAGRTSSISRRWSASTVAVATRRSRLDATRTTTLSLPKPLGLILEEVEEGQASGVFVASVSEVGSAATYAREIVGSKLLSVQGQAVTALGFDAVMDTIINAPATVELVFDGKDSKLSSAPTTELAVGTIVKIVVLNGSKDGSSNLEISNAKVGDNLRQTLLDNGFEVYQGLKQKLGNCGGAGQCTFCAMEFVESEGWLERSDYEDGKLGQRNPKARLACLNTIQGPATIQKAQR
jgi:ferredoxin